MHGLGFDISCILLPEISYKQVYWRVEYLANLSVIFVGVTSIW